MAAQKSFEHTSFDHKLKMLLLGYSGAGKTCLLMRYAHKAFTETYITTIGIDYRVKYNTIDDKVYRVMWWDTAGQERFRSISASYIKGAQGVAVVFDLCDRASFVDAERWIKDIRASTQASIVLLGNKLDLPDQQVTPEEIAQFAKKHNVQHFLVSARTGQGVDQALDTLVHLTAAALPKDPLSRSALALASKPQTESRDCCH